MIWTREPTKGSKILHWVSRWFKHVPVSVLVCTPEARLYLVLHFRFRGEAVLNPDILNLQWFFNLLKLSQNIPNVSYSLLAQNRVLSALLSPVHTDSESLFYDVFHDLMFFQNQHISHKQQRRTQTQATDSGAGDMEEISQFNWTSGESNWLWLRSTLSFITF